MVHGISSSIIFVRYISFLSQETLVSAAVLISIVLPSTDENDTNLFHRKTAALSSYFAPHSLTLSLFIVSGHDKNACTLAELGFKNRQQVVVSQVQ